MGTFLRDFLHRFTADSSTLLMMKGDIFPRDFLHRFTADSSTLLMMKGRIVPRSHVHYFGRSFKKATRS